MIEFCFDFISPYAHLAWLQMEKLGERLGHEVRPVPVLLAGMLSALGTRGPAEVPARRAYLFKNLIRVAHRSGTRIVPPKAHPFSPILPLRIACLASLEPRMRSQVITTLFRTAWMEGGSIDTAEAISDSLRRVGIDAAPLLEEAALPEAKDRLRSNTDDALARGAFGVPSMFVDGELFFGFDSFPDLEAYVKGQDPVPAEADMLERWRTLPASAQRKLPPTS